MIADYIQAALDVAHYEIIDNPEPYYGEVSALPGVALAADSAVTASIGRGVKVFPSANKLFTLSKYEPVGIMIYNAAEMLGLPWETAVKTYRKELSTRSHSHVQDYAVDFLNFLESHGGLFPTHRKDSFGVDEIQTTLAGRVHPRY